MIAISILTFRRAAETASVMLYIMGFVIANVVSDAPVFELLDMDPKRGKESTILFGTVLLVGLGVLVSVFNAASDIPRDKSSRFIAILLSRPLSRFEYLLGKYFGTLCLGLFNTISWITALVFFRSESMSMQQMLDQYTILLVFLPATAIAITISCFLADIVSMVVTFIVLIFSVVNGIVPILLAISPGSIQKFILNIYFVFPNFLLFLQNYNDMIGFASLLVYSLSLSAIFLYFAYLIFDSGDVF